MNNQLAEEAIADKDVAAELRQMNEKENSELAHLIDQMAIIQDIFSSKRPFKNDETTHKQFGKMKEILDDLSDWEKEIQNSTLDEKGKKYSFLPKSTMLAWRLILTNVPNICCWMFEKFPGCYIFGATFKNLQNILENYFSQVYLLAYKAKTLQQRDKGGQGSSVSLMTYVWNARAISLTNIFSQSLKANAGLEKTNGSSLLKLERKKRKSIESKPYPTKIPPNQLV